mmetsp:Transcript_19275/g.51224  ORF Transcript_19275/g.51224 Transcript_19275/m.51224 type:complete len:126 (-) Transcript_19275:715-1092(-)
MTGAAMLIASTADLGDTGAAPTANAALSLLLLVGMEAAIGACSAAGMTAADGGAADGGGPARAVMWAGGAAAARAQAGAGNDHQPAWQLPERQGASCEPHASKCGPRSIVCDRQRQRLNGPFRNR